MFPAMCGNRLGRGRIALCRRGVKQLRGGRDFRLYQAQSELTGLKATYSIKVQAGDIVGGLILAPKPLPEDRQRSAWQFDQTSSRLRRQKGRGDTKTALFVHYTTPTTINGVVTPAGTYMSAAFIPYAVINDLHF